MKEKDKKKKIRSLEKQMKKHSNNGKILNRLFTRIETIKNSK